MGSTPDALKRAFYDGVPPWDARTDYFIHSVLGGIPGIGQVLKAQDEVRYMDDYLRNRGMDYSDIRYMSRTGAYQSVAGTVSFVSSNIERLYK